MPREETAEPVSQDQILGRERIQGSIDHEQDWQPYLVDPYSAMSDGWPYLAQTVLIVRYKYHVLVWT